MTISNTSNNYAVAVGTSSDSVAVPVISQVDPTAYNSRYPIGKRWINDVANNEWALTSFSSAGGILTANWQISASPTLILSELSGDTGVAHPVAGNITLAGTADQITTAASGSTVTFSLIGPYTPATYTAHGVLIGEGASSIVAVSPDATSGIALISQGATTDPAYGTVVVAGGGTGVATLTAHGVLLGEGTSPVVATAVGSTGQVLIGATGADPAFGALGVNSSLTAHGVLLGEGTSAIVATAVGSNGQVLIGSTGADPAFGTISSTTGITFTTGAGSLAINTTGGGLKANAESAGGPFAGATQNSYIFSESAQTTVSLPTTSAIGDLFIVCGTNTNSGGWVVSQTTGQEIFSTTNHTTSGSGTISTGAVNTSAILMCTAANTTWIVLAATGTIIYA